MNRTDWLAVGIMFALIVGLVVYTRILMGAYVEEKEHAEFLYDCCYFDEPNVCENKWLAYNAEQSK